MKNVNENKTEINSESTEYTPNGKPPAFGSLVMTRGIVELMEGIEREDG